jgi:hypothetical protein
MAGFWHLSHHQMRDINGRVYVGAKAYFYSASTLDSIDVFADYGLGTKLPNPVQANGAGIFPPVFFDEADAFYRQRITTSSGVIIEGTDVGTLPIIGPSGGGGGSEVPVDPNALLKTGYPLWLPISGSLTGFVRMNGRTIGPATSGASERANADCEFLFSYLWQTYSDSLCPVTGGRGINSAADWSANKQIGLLNMQNRGAFGLSDMGNADTGAFASVPFSVGNGTTPASSGGESLHTLVKGEAPTGLITLNDPGHTHGGSMSPNFSPGSGDHPMIGDSANSDHTYTTNNSPTGVTLTDHGGDGAHNNMPPFMTGTWYQKL